MRDEGECNADAPRYPRDHPGGSGPSRWRPHSRRAPAPYRPLRAGRAFCAWALRGDRKHGTHDRPDSEGANAPVRHLRNPYEQCRYAYDKIKRLLATHGASLADAVKQVVYVTDVRFQADVAKCRREAYGDGPIPANTFLVINALAIPGMLLEIDVTAAVGR